MMMVSQEILIYLSLFISTEPQLFQGMIRIRIGLIIQVMIGELKRTISCSGIFLIKNGSLKNKVTCFLLNRHIKKHEDKNNVLPH